jgi:hypothetical protein
MTTLKAAQKPRLEAPDMSEYEALDYHAASALLARAGALVLEAQAVEAEVLRYQEMIGAAGDLQSLGGGLHEPAGAAVEAAEEVQDWIAEILMKRTGAVVVFPGDDTWPTRRRRARNERAGRGDRGDGCRA